MWIKIILVLVALLSVIIIFDARPIVRRFFTRADRNSASILLKVIGTIILLLSIFLFSLI